MESKYINILCGLNVSLGSCSNLLRVSHVYYHYNTVARIFDYNLQ